MTSSKPLLTLIINTCAGHRGLFQQSLPDQLAQVFEKHGFEVNTAIICNPDDIGPIVQKALAEYRTRQGMIVGAGGDGTLNSIAQRLLHSNVPLGIIPLGTFNYVARVLGIPLDPLAAADIAMKGVARWVHVGRVNQYIYLNNASLGLYPTLIEQRENDKHRFGRFKAVALVSGLAVLMKEHQTMKLQMQIDGHPEWIETPVVFFGNNQLQLQDMHLELANCAAQGKLAAVAVQGMTPLNTLKLIAKMQLGTFEQSPEVIRYCADTIIIKSASRHLKVAIDGEIVQMTTPLRFQVVREGIKIMVPRATASV